MKHGNVIVFGANEYASQISVQLQKDYETVHRYVLEESEYLSRKEEGLEVSLFDLSDDWDDFLKKYDLDDTLIYCALNDDAENIFLTISLRAAFENIYMVALAKNSESANKLKMAGASKVIPVIQTTANTIVDILEKPITTSVLHDIFYDRSNLKIAEIRLRDISEIIGRRVSEVHWQDEFNLLVIGFVDIIGETHFVLSSENHHHQLQANDVLIIIGYDEDINSLTHKVGETHV